MADYILAEARDSKRAAGDLTWRWMAHHIAQLMDLAEHGPREGRASAASECREAILAFWRHRYCMEVGRRPFEAYLPLAEALAERGDPWARRRWHAPELLEAAGDRQLAALRDVEAGADSAAELVAALVAARLGSNEVVPDLTILDDAEAVSPDAPDVRVVRLLRQTSDLVLPADPARAADRRRITKALDLLAARASELAEEVRRVSGALAGGGPAPPGTA